MSFHKITIVCFALALFVAVPAFASETNGTTDSTYKYAWGENLGWVNMKPDNGGLTITDSGVTGFAWSSIGGWINFSPTNSGQGVIVDPTTGALSGYAWSSQYGWINMSGVTINSSGLFVGVAGVASTTAGRITFDCDNCDVRTDWRPIPARTVVEDQPRSSGGRSSSAASIGGAAGGTVGGGNQQSVSTGDVGSGNADISGLLPDSIQQSNTGGAGSKNGSSIPSQLFDINLEMDQEMVGDIQDLSARVVFMSFGKVPTPVELIFDILNASGTVVHSEKDEVTVETEKVFTKKFSANTLPYGKYTLKLHTLYNTSVKDEFTAPFEISPDVPRSSASSWWMILLLVIGLIWLIVFVVRRRSQQQN